MSLARGRARPATRAALLALVTIAALASEACVTPESTANGCGALRFEAPVLVLETEYSGATSALGRLGEDGCLAEVADVALPHNASLRSAHGRPFVLDDDGGLLIAIRPDVLAVSGTFAAYAERPEERPNPHDVDVDAAGRLWVTRYDLGSLAILDASGAFGEAVDLSDLDPDGVPEMDAIRVHGDRAFVAFESLDRAAFPWLPKRRGGVAILDVAPPHARRGVIDLVGHNPAGRFISMNAAGSLVAVPTPGSFYAIDDDDGVDAVDLEAGTARQIVSERALGGSVFDVAVASPTEAYALVLGPADPNPSKVVAFDPTTGALTGAPLVSFSGFASAGIAVVGDLVLVADFTRGAAKIRVFDRATHAARGDVAPKLLAPWSLLSLGP
jgi:hypothetical protein